MAKFCLLPILAFSVTLHAAPAQPQPSPDGFRERLVLGTVVDVQPELSFITIRESDLLGRLRIRFKAYHVKQPFLLFGLRPGDKITAVFAARDNLLHRIRRVASYRAFASDVGH
jgi:hypothetical protein